MIRLNLLSHIRNKASHLAFNNIVYNWSLGGSIPRGLDTRIANSWHGDAEKGRWLCSGAFAMDGETLELHGDSWEPEGVNDKWLSHLHSFEWLRDLKTLGGDQARLQGRQMIESWLKRYQVCQPNIWRADYTGRRLASWVTFFDFFVETSEEPFQDLFFESLIRQARHLSRALVTAPEGLGVLQAAKGLAFCGIALQGREGWLEQALDCLQEESKKQILPDGGHISRSPQILLNVLQLYIDIRLALLAGGYPIPPELEHTIDRMAQAYRFFRYADKNLALFHGAQEGDSALSDAVLAKSNARGKLLKELPQSGYHRLVLGRSQVMVDSGAPAPYPYDGEAHASALSFEFIYGKQRVFVSCGSQPIDPVWNDAMRATAAHNTLSLDHRNSSEVKADHHLGRRPKNVSVHREDNKDAMLLEISHDGYVPVNGITHRRRYFLGNNGHDLRGEDSLSSSIDMARPVDVAIRFHLHPRVLVSLIREGQEALLRLPGGAGWRFQHSVGNLSLENSVYLGDGTRPRKTKQLVITGRMDQEHALIKWALHREGS